MSMLLLYQAFAIGFVALFTKIAGIYGSLGFQFFDALLLALLLGKPISEALIIGAAVGLAFYGTMQIGGVLPQDTVFGGVVGQGFALILNAKPAVAVALAVPISMIAVVIWNVLVFWYSYNVNLFQKYIDQRNLRKFNRLWYLQLVVYGLSYFVVAFIAVLFGTGGIKALIDMIPKEFLTAMTVAAGMLPAVGMGLLLKYVWNIAYIPYFIAGFALAAYLKLPIMAIAIFGLVFGMIAFFIDRQFQQSAKNGGKKVSAGTTNSTGEDFFND